MKKSKRSQAQTLLDAMGLVDDSYLNEALSYAPAQEKKFNILRSPAMRIIPTVAALAAVLAMVFLGPLRGVLRNTVNDNAEIEQNGEMPAADTSPAALNRLLKTCTESPSFQTISAEDVPFFDGNVRLTVQQLDTGELFISQPLTETQQQRLWLELQSNGGESPSENDSEKQYAVWITLGNGQVATPYLAPSSGNLGAADLFQYKAERIPSELFFTLLVDLT